MVALTNERLIGASVIEQETFEALVAHESDEEEVIAGYESLATETRSEVVRYLIGLILEDERRHHRVLEQLANTIRFQATLDDRGTHLPYLDVHRSRDRALLDQTRRFRAVERKDRAQLKHLAKSMRASGGEHEAFVVDLLRSDTERHLAILRFIEHLVRRSPLS